MNFELNISGMTWTLLGHNVLLHNCSVTRSRIQSISCKTCTLLGHPICTSISKTCALCISKAGALLVHVECTSLGNSWELPSLLLWCVQKQSPYTRLNRLLDLEDVGSFHSKPKCFQTGAVLPDGVTTSHSQSLELVATNMPSLLHWLQPLCEFPHVAKGQLALHALCNNRIPPCTPQ